MGIFLELLVGAVNRAVAVLIREKESTEPVREQL